MKTNVQNKLRFNAAGSTSPKTTVALRQYLQIKNSQDLFHRKVRSSFLLNPDPIKLISD